MSSLQTNQARRCVVFLTLEQNRRVKAELRFNGGWLLQEMEYVENPIRASGNKRIWQSRRTREVGHDDRDGLTQFFQEVGHEDQIDTFIRKMAAELQGAPREHEAHRPRW